MIKLIVCDMDGTLACENGQLPSDFGSTLENMKKNHVLFAVASGRPYQALYEILSPYGENIIYISQNGAHCQYKDEIFYEKIFDKKVIKNFEGYFSNGEGILAGCGSKCYYIRERNPEFIKSLSEFEIKYELIDDFLEVNEDIFQLTVFFEKGIESVQDLKLYKELGHQYEIVKTHPYWIDIYQKGINKGTGIETIYGKLHIGSEETAAFGDLYNDIPMFQKVAHSYCMKSAPKDVQLYAKNIVNGDAGNSVTRIINEII